MEKAFEVGVPLSPPPAKFDGEMKVDSEAVEFDDDAPPPSLKTMVSDGEDVEMESDGDEEDECEMECDCEDEEDADEAEAEEEVELVFYDSDASEDDEELFAGSPLSADITVVPEGEFLGPANFAVAGYTAGFMRVAAGGNDDPVNGGQEIVVLYRYTLFKRTWRDPSGVLLKKWRSVTRLHRLRFIVPASGDTATSLPFAGACLSPLIYHEDYTDQLEALWLKLSAPAIERIPRGATRLLVVVDVGILKPGDDTPARREYVRAELESKKELPWPGRLGGMQLHLPEPVAVTSRNRKDDISDVAPPAKRRKVIAAGEECPVCLDELDAGAVAWPGCSVAHVFHGRCLETTLKRSQMCPICRRDLGQTTLQD